MIIDKVKELCREYCKYLSYCRHRLSKTIVFKRSHSFDDLWGPSFTLRYNGKKILKFNTWERDDYFRFNELLMYNRSKLDDYVIVAELCKNVLQERIKTEKEVEDRLEAFRELLNEKE